MKPHVHYEQAFEHYLQTHEIPRVAVDEARRAAFREAKLKSFDFIVYSPHQVNWLVDIKGRRVKVNATGRRRTWENWVTQADLDALRVWQEVFGAGYRGLFVFAYLIPDALDTPPEIVHAHRDNTYVFAGVAVDDYALHARQRSPKWGTVNMPTKEFVSHVRPLVDWL